MKTMSIKLSFGSGGSRRDKPPDLGWRWQLVDADGMVGAESPRSFRGREQCLANCRAFLFLVWSCPHILLPVEGLTDAPVRAAA